MKTHVITYDLICVNCKSVRPNGSVVINMREPKVYESREVLIDECNNFSKVACGRCGSTGRWLTLKIQLEGEKRISKQFVLTINQDATSVTYFIEGGIEQFSEDDLRLALNAIMYDVTPSKLQKEDKSFLPNLFNVEKSAIIAVDLFESAPVAKANVIYNRGVDFDTLLQLITFIEDKIFPEEEEEDDRSLVLLVKEEGNKVSSRIEGGDEQYSRDELRLSFDLMLNNLCEGVEFGGEFDYVKDSSTTESCARIKIQFLNHAPFAEVESVSISNMARSTVAGLVIFLQNRVA